MALGCKAQTTVDFEVRDRCNQKKVVSAKFLIQDLRPPNISLPAASRAITSLTIGGLSEEEEEGEREDQK